MATQTMQRKAKEIEAALNAAGVEGFDPAAIIAFIKEILALFGVCPAMTPAKAQQRMRALATGRWYLGKNLDENRLRQIVRNSGCCEDEDTLDAVTAATKDVGGNLSVAEVAALMQEAQ